MKLSLSRLQPLGRALMLPIAVLPIAGLLLRLGQPDLLNIPFVAAAGQAVFANLGLLFAIGVAVGFAKDNNGAAGLAGVVCYLVALEGAKAFLVAPPETTAGLTGKAAELAIAAFKDNALSRLGVPIGIVSGLIAGDFYNRFSGLKLPEYLAFFGGRRFVPIASGVAGLLLAALVGFSWTWLDHGVDQLSRGVVGSGEIGLFVYGTLNRLLIVTGLHHILNNIAWFVVGEYNGATGDLNRFFAGDPTAGSFMAGYFAVFMFGLPAACLAIYHAARPERRKAVGGMLFSLALTAFLTGVTEPIEFTFMFLAPVLYAIHTVLTGAALVIMSLLEVRLGFTFSAGLFDYVINYGLAERPLLLLPVGAVYFGLYYGLFRFFIARFDLKTPGREEEGIAASTSSTRLPAEGGRAAGFVEALGGAGNLVSIGACTTRLRIVVAEKAPVDEPALKALGARGVVWPSPTDIQVVLGPTADAVADEMRMHVARFGSASGPALSPAAAPVRPTTHAHEPFLAGLGGAANVTEMISVAGRLLVTVKQAEAVSETALKAAGARAIARTGPTRLQILLRPATSPAQA